MISGHTTPRIRRRRGPDDDCTCSVVCHRPVAVAFDVVETLMPLEPLRERFTAIGLPPHLLDLQPMTDMPADP